MQILLLLLACVLVPRTETGEIIRGHKVKPHSRPYMAYIRFSKQKEEACSGFLIKEDFVLTAARCLGSFMNVTLGAHDIRQKEETQQRIRVKKPIPHPDYDNKTHVNDIMLLQLEKRAELTKAVCMLQLPKTKIPGDFGGPLVCDKVAQGIVSYKRNNGTSPLIFTRISYFLPWIKNTINSLQMKKSD
ncbi:PREDICTED: duodenase-1-like [Chrysochloris asiatica]|uniref:Duodenase-1-like n=1 Tax=Chrysochloris asiatica TaxID=185453 RepID=A0A9B0T7Q4_CHRAS|nr:PREDICTED: duodenase-1-like [Chrysochloris asiatica]